MMKTRKFALANFLVLLVSLDKSNLRLYNIQRVVFVLNIARRN